MLQNANQILLELHLRRVEQTCGRRIRFVHKGLRIGDSVRGLHRTEGAQSRLSNRWQHRLSQVQETILLSHVLHITMLSQIEAIADLLLHKWGARIVSKSGRRNRKLVIRRHY